MSEHIPSQRTLLERLYHIDSDNPYIVRRARGLLSIYLASIPLPIIFAILSWRFIDPERHLANHIILCCLAAAQLLGIWFAKNARVDAGSVLVSTILSVAIGGYMLMLQTYTNVIWFMILSVIIASINVRPQIIWLSAAFNIAIMLVLMAIIPGDAVGPNVKLFINVMLIALILLVALITYTTATLTTVSGGKLTARLSGDTIVITDAAGGTTAVTTADVMTSNGVIHVTDGVFLPG